MSDGNRNLASKSFIALLWGTGGAFARILLTLGTQIVLARLLGPTEYGLFALGVMMVMLSTYFSDIGLAYGLIQKPVVTTDDVRFVWTWQCILGVAVALALYFSAGKLASFFKKPEAETVFAWLAIVSLLNALAAPSTNLLKKRLDYKALQLAQLSSYTLGYVCVGIPLAMSGYGISSLLAAWLVQSVTNLGFLYAPVRHPLSFKLLTAGSGKMLRYGGTVFATNVINWLLTTADKVMIGRFFPASIVGLYTTSFNLVNSPTAAVYGNLQSVVFSACARLQDNPTALKDVFLRLLAVVTLVAFPLFAVVGVNAELVMVAIYGPLWSDAAPFLRVFAFVMPFLLVWGVSTPILWNTGHTKTEFWLQIPMILVWLAVLFSAAKSPPETIALVISGLLAGRCMVMALAAARCVGVPVSALFPAIRGGLWLTLLMTGTAALLALPIAALDIVAIARLLVLLLACGAAYILFVLTLAPWLLDAQLTGVLANQRHRVPARLQLLVGILLRGTNK